ncbi:hypothetical protein VCHA50P420_80011 [Vibrio chagasii]|nr:hypothetical protein VCHA36P161_10236 [Vibrio chagasii]CAH7220614.1 hypothetical protein VCHA40P238_20696 [Vibrio chagasii]CAH7482622.1 hypothetical protein VCHA50P420_80011 [Vibrio chagasii]
MHLSLGGCLTAPLPYITYKKKASKPQKHIATTYEIKHLYIFFDTIDILYNLVA